MNFYLSYSHSNTLDLYSDTQEMYSFVLQDNNQLPMHAQPFNLQTFLDKTNSKYKQNNVTHAHERSYSLK